MTPEMMGKVVCDLIVNENFMNLDDMYKFVNEMRKHELRGKGEKEFVSILFDRKAKFEQRVRDLREFLKTVRISNK